MIFHAKCLGCGHVAVAETFGCEDVDFGLDHDPKCPVLHAVRCGIRVDVPAWFDIELHHTTSTN